MKRVNNLYYNLLTYDNLYNSYLICRKNKSYRKDVIIYSLNYELYLNECLDKLKNNKYVFSDYTEFYIFEPKKRKVLSAKFCDRVVHTWIVTYILNPVFNKSFINTSYACIKDKGMHKCALDVRKAISKWKNIYPDGYILKFDVSKYFASIDKNILFNIIKRKIKDKNVLNLIYNILSSSSKYFEDSKIGIPIGNLTSQSFANIYLNELDKYIKHNLKCKYYFRYMDDGVLLCKDKYEVKYFLDMIKVFLNNKLKLKLNKKTSYFKLRQGVNFCGYYITYNRLRIRFKGKQKLKKKIKLIYYLIENRKITISEAKKLLNGHVGYINIADSYNLIESVFK